MRASRRARSPPGGSTHRGQPTRRAPRSVTLRPRPSTGGHRAQATSGPPDGAMSGSGAPDRTVGAGAGRRRPPATAPGDGSPNGLPTRPPSRGVRRPAAARRPVSAGGGHRQVESGRRATGPGVRLPGRLALGRADREAALEAVVATGPQGDRRRRGHAVGLRVATARGEPAPRRGRDHVGRTAGDGLERRVAGPLDPRDRVQQGGRVRVAGRGGTATRRRTTRRSARRT